MSAIPDSTTRVLTDTGPFTIIPEWVLDASISSTAVRLYGVLGRFSDQTGICWPSRRTLAKRLNVSSPRTVDNALGELRMIGAIEVTPRTDPETGQTSNLYLVRRAQLNAHPLAADCEGGSRADCEGPLAEICSQNESHAEREPVERDQAGANADFVPDPLLVRLLKVCTGPRIRVVQEAPKVLSRLREHFADHVIDEGIGVCELVETPPQFPRYLLKVVQERSEETGVFVPDLFEGFKGDAA